MLQENLIIIIIFLLLIILLLMVLISVVIFKLLLSKKEIKLSTHEKMEPEIKISQMIHPVASKNESDLKVEKYALEKVTEKFFCSNHPESSCVGACLICEDVFCEKCLLEHEGMYFCKEHFKTFANHKWKQITDVKTTPQTPEEGLFVYHYKRFLWKEKQIPSFVLTHYKINLDTDTIESYIQLNVIDSLAEELLEDLLRNHKI